MREIVHEVDFCVVGGGMAGLCAAVSAARKGIRVAIMQDRPMFGGNASSEIRMWICGSQLKDTRETGLIEEIFLDNFYSNPSYSFSIWDTVLFEKVMLEKNIEMILNCSCLDCETEKNTIKSIKGWQTTTQSYHIVRAKYFADCSGDSILAPLSGAEFMLGRESKEQFNESIAPDVADKKTMGMSCLLQARETLKPQKFVPPSWAYKYETDADLPDTGHLNDGVNNYWWIELGGDKDSIADTEELRNELLKIVFGVWDHVKNKGDHGAENWVLDWVGLLPGKRESRRYVGDVIITQNDVETGGQYDDIVAYGGWTMDNHFPEGFYFKPGCSAVTIQHPVKQAWGIPWRSLYSRNVTNLLFAGRNISATHVTLSSSRVMATCAIIGQAVGTGVAQAVKENTDIRSIDIHKLQQTLLSDDCYLPNVKRELSDLTKNARINAEVVRNGRDRGEHNLWIGEKDEFLEYKFEKACFVNKVRIIFDSNLNRDYRNMPCNFPLEEKNLKLPETLIKDYSLSYILENGSEEQINVENSHRRFVLHDINKPVKSIRLIPKSTWGDKYFRIFDFEIL